MMPTNGRKVSTVLVKVRAKDIVSPVGASMAHGWHDLCPNGPGASFEVAGAEER